MKHVSKWNIVLFLAPTIILFIFVFAIPFFTVIITSFFNYRIGSPFVFTAFQNYLEAFKDPNFHKSFVNTMIWMFLQSTVHVGLGLILAIILSTKIFMWKVFRVIVMIPNVISMAVLGVIFLNIFNPQIGLVNGVIRVVTGNPEFTHNWYFNTATSFLTVTSTWLFYVGLITLLCLAGIMSVPKDIYEAATIDGASFFKKTVRITIPLIRNVIGTCVLISATSMLKEFELIYLTTKGGPGNITMNMPLLLYKKALIDNNFGYANVVGTILIIIGVIAILFINKTFSIGKSDLE